MTTNALPESYHAGQYSCTCPACNGEGVVWMDYPEVARQKVAQTNEKIAAKQKKGKDKEE